MPWNCERCGADVAADDEATCPTCQAPKAAWTLVAEKTRHFVVSGKKLVVLRGQDATARAADDPARASDEWTPAARAVSLPKAAARELVARGLLPASRDLLLVRLLAKGAKDLTITLVIDRAQHEPEEVQFEPFDPPDDAGATQVPVLLVHGADDPEVIEFDGVRVVDVTEDDGHALEVEVSALKKPPVRLPIGGVHWTAVRLVEPDGRPAADVGVVLVLEGGERRPARTDADGNARWDDVPEAPVELELEDADCYPDEAPPEPAPEQPDEEVLPPDDVSLPPWLAGDRWTAVRLVGPDGRPAPGVEVALILEDGGRRVATTDADGSARWDDVPEGRVELELVDPTYEPEVHEEASVVEEAEPELAQAPDEDDGPRGKHPDWLVLT